MCSRIFLADTNETCPCHQHVIISLSIIIMSFRLCFLHSKTDWLFIIVFLIQEMIIQSHDSLVLVLLISFFQFFKWYWNLFVSFLLKKNCFVILYIIFFTSLFLYHKIIVLNFWLVVRCNTFVNHIIYYVCSCRLFFFRVEITSLSSSALPIFNSFPPVSLIFVGLI